MKTTLTNGLILMASIAMFSSCSKDDNFNAGWDSEIISTTISLNRASDDQIDLGSINLSETIEDYMSQNYDDAKSYRVLNAGPSFGLVVSVDVLPLGFVEALDVYAISGSQELLIGMISSGSSQDASFGLAGIDQNLIDFAGDESIDIVLRPQFNDLGAPGTVEADVAFTFNFSISGRR